MRPCFNEANLESSFQNARNEAEKAFGNGDIEVMNISQTEEINLTSVKFDNGIP